VDPDFDVAAPALGRAVTGAAVLLHPHPHFGGDRFHPLVDTLFRLLPSIGFGAVRFDFSSADAETAVAAASAAVDEVGRRFGSACPTAVVGYSFGAGVAAQLDASSLAAWVLVAPQTGPLTDAPIAASSGPKLVIVAERDQFSPADDVADLASLWPATTVEVVGGDHFLAATLGTIVERVVEWLPGAVARSG
jgi:alpha/beta superfamily hydrolase